MGRDGRRKKKRVRTNASARCDVAANVWPVTLQHLQVDRLSHPPFCRSPLASRLVELLIAVLVRASVSRGRAAPCRRLVSLPCVSAPNSCMAPHRLSFFQLGGEPQGPTTSDTPPIALKVHSNLCCAVQLGSASACVMCGTVVLWHRIPGGRPLTALCAYTRAVCTFLTVRDGLSATWFSLSLRALALGELLNCRACFVWCARRIPQQTPNLAVSPLTHNNKTIPPRNPHLQYGSNAAAHCHGVVDRPTHLR
jgi:hypothetical protein